MGVLKSLRVATKYVANKDQFEPLLAPEDELILDGHDPAGVEAMSAAVQGDRSALVALLVDARERQDWERRGDLIRRVSDLSLLAPQWLDEWRGESSDDPDCASVTAQWLVKEAWSQRSSALAKHVSEEQFQAFHTLLDDATHWLQHAVDIAPAGDPFPWEVAIWHAIGSEAPREIFDDYVTAAARVAPHDFGWRSAALAYVDPYWFGSADESWGFARETADAAPSDSLLQLLPLHAANRSLSRDYLDHGKKGGPRNAEFEHRIDEAVPRALALADLAGTDPVRRSMIHNSVASELSQVRRHAQAFDVFVAIGRHVASQPWAQISDEPLAAFRSFRTLALMERASQG